MCLENSKGVARDTAIAYRYTTVVSGKGIGKVIHVLRKVIGGPTASVRNHLDL